MECQKCKALEAEVARLHKWADGFSDAQLKERATGEAYQRELRGLLRRCLGHIQTPLNIVALDALASDIYRAIGESRHTQGG